MTKLKDDVDVRTTIIAKTPLGSGFDEVLLFCKLNGLSCDSRKNVGILTAEHTTVGVQSIRAIYGEGRGELGLASIQFVNWGFDQHGKLIEVLIRRETDGL